MELPLWMYGAVPGAAALGAALGLVLKGSKARVQISGDTLQVHENESRLDWMTKTEERAEQERALRLAAEQRERDTHSLYMRTKLELEQVNERMARMEKRLQLISELLLIERPDLADAVGLTQVSKLAPL